MKILNAFLKLLHSLAVIANGSSGAPEKNGNEVAFNI